MSSSVRRVRELVARYRTDGRLPPAVAALYTETLSLRRRAAVERRLAEIRHVAGSPDTTGGEHLTAGVDGWRRFLTAGDLDDSFDETALRNADVVFGALAAHGVDAFVVDRVDDAVLIGIERCDRAAALHALSTTIVDEAWFVAWERGHRHGDVTLSVAHDNRDLRRASSWVVFRQYSWGERAVGRAQGVRITFWEPGTSGQLEMIGTRGQQRFDLRCDHTIEVVDGHRYPGRTAFPVGSNLERFSEPIDVVYTWVDGGDARWQEAFRATAEQEGREVGERALDPARYRNRDELRYSLRSLWAYCGWVNRIYIVTAGQVPVWLRDDARIHVVDHSEILPADALPTFNSHAIEAALHRIPGLSEHFVYFNDDMFVGRSMRPEHFFTSNGLAKVFPSDARVPGVEDDATLAVDTAARRGRELLLERFGRVVSYKPLHSPYPLRRSAIVELEREFADIVERTKRSRFRSPGDLSIAASFAQHYALATERAILSTIATDYVHVESGRLGWHLDRIRLGNGFDTFCINETEVDGGTDQREIAIRRFLDECFPVPAPWE